MNNNSLVSLFRLVYFDNIRRRTKKLICLLINSLIFRKKNFCNYLVIQKEN